MTSELYQKNISINAEWEINIDYRDRNQYIKLFEENDQVSDVKQELYSIFESCVKTTYGLFLFSFKSQ